MPSTLLCSLYQAVQAAIDAGHVGVPVFVRCVAHTAPDREGLPEALGHVAAIAGVWLGAPVRRVYTQGGIDAGQLTVTLQYTGGQSALVSVSPAPGDGGPCIDLMLLGNTGAIYHEGVPLPSAAVAALGPPCGDLPALPAALARALETSLRTGQPVAVETTDDRRQTTDESDGATEATRRRGASTAPAVSPSPRLPVSPSPRLPYGVLLVTGGRTHQENYAALFAADARCRLVAVADEADVPPQRAAWNRQFAEALGLPYIPDLDAALAREDVQIASICSEHERRGRVTVRCAEAGKHVYIDKPMTCRVADADAVVAAVERTGVRSQVFSFIHTPWSETAKRIVASGQIGDLVAVHCDVMFAKGHPGTAPLGTPRRQEPHPTRFTFPDSKRELRATGVYALGIVRNVTGRAVETVYGVTENYFFAEHFRNGTEDFGLLALTLEGGLTATITAGRIGWRSHPAAGPSRIHLIGTHGAVVVDAYQPRLEIYNHAAPWAPPPPHPEDPMAFWESTRKATGEAPRHHWTPLRGPGPGPNDASRFLDCLDAGRESPMSAREGAAIVETLMAGYVSAAKGEVVALPLPRGA